MSSERPSSKFDVFGGVDRQTSSPWAARGRLTETHRWWVFAALGVLVVALVLWALWPSAAKPKPVPPIPVTVVSVTRQNVPVSVGAIGAAQAWTSIAVLAQVSGKLVSVNFTEGAEVKAGQVLAQIDPSAYRAALTQAEGALKRDQALLEDAKLNLVRYQALLAQNAISKQQADTQAAQVRQDEGTVLIDEGTVAAAKVNLDWCTITSPIAGRAGVRLVDPGNLVSAGGSVSSTPSTASSANASSPTSSTNTGSSGGSAIVVVNQIKPMAVTFTVPEGDFQRLAELSDGFRKPLQTKAFSQETGALLATGNLSIADNRIDPTTGTVELKARFDNADEKLWPGEFINVQLTTQVLENATTIPADAVNRGPNGSFAFVVDEKNVASIRPITVAWTQGDIAVIGKGLKPGDLVVTDGQMTLKNGSVVKAISTSRRRA
jgi:multidrug efflux system membrane fusion protein